MKPNIEFKGIEKTSSDSEERIRKLIEELMRKVERRVKNFPPDDVFLRVLVEQNRAHSLYRISVTLDVPGKTLAAKTETHEAEGAVRDAFTEVIRQLEEHKSTLRRERLW